MGTTQGRRSGRCCLGRADHDGGDRDGGARDRRRGAVVVAEKLGPARRFEERISCFWAAYFWATLLSVVLCSFCTCYCRLCPVLVVLSKGTGEGMEGDGSEGGLPETKVLDRMLLFLFRKDHSIVP